MTNKLGKKFGNIFILFLLVFISSCNLKSYEKEITKNDTPSIDININKKKLSKIEKILFLIKKEEEKRNYKKAINLHKKIRNIEEKEYGFKSEEVANRDLIIGNLYGNLGYYKDSYLYLSKAYHFHMNLNF